eukprot:6361943-Pyramimonas_sp.AAC.2
MEITSLCLGYGVWIRPPHVRLIDIKRVQIRAGPRMGPAGALRYFGPALVARSQHDPCGRCGRERWGRVPPGARSPSDARGVDRFAAISVVREHIQSIVMSS